MHRKPSIQMGYKILKEFWPDFDELEDMVFIVGKSTMPPASSLRDPEFPLDKTSAETFYSHTHIMDIFTHRANREVNSGDFGQPLDSDHPDFQLMCAVGKQMARLWFLKLKQDFPQYRFRVYYSQNDDPIVRFHRVRGDEPNWLNKHSYEEEIMQGKIVILDTADSGSRSGGAEERPGK